MAATTSPIWERINTYLSEQLQTRVYVGHCPEDQWTNWVQRVGERLAAHPECKAEINNRLHYIHAEAEKYLRTHEDHTGAMPRMIYATEKWLDAVGPANGVDALNFLLGL